MKKINLRGLYPFYHNDMFVKVSDEVATALAEAERQEAAYRPRTYPATKHSILLTMRTELSMMRFCGIVPCETYERKATAQELRTALDVLPKTQG